MFQQCFCSTLSKGWSQNSHHEWNKEEDNSYNNRHNKTTALGRGQRKVSCTMQFQDPEEKANNSYLGEKKNAYARFVGRTLFHRSLEKCGCNSQAVKWAHEERTEGGKIYTAQLLSQ